MLWLWGFKSSVWNIWNHQWCHQRTKNIKQLQKTCLKASWIDSKQDWALKMNFRTSVFAWVAHLLRGSLGPGGSRPLQLHTAEMTYVGRSAQVGRSRPGGSLEPQNSVHAVLKLEIGPPISKTRFGCCCWCKWNLLGFYIWYKYLHNQILFQI